MHYRTLSPGAAAAAAPAGHVTAGPAERPAEVGALHSPAPAPTAARNKGSAEATRWPPATKLSWAVSGGKRRAASGWLGGVGARPGRLDVAWWACGGAVRRSSVCCAVRVEQEYLNPALELEERLHVPSKKL